ncbi:hypothetical protein BTO18_06815 [Polaribacter porphyrae]|uniref:Oxygen sensor histidine kinase NreB n=1 Tax=Polaribacter porphyrae TaxID=1137780 RepID=A0A2S7WTM5_9FLAO|nr:hypothetical protein BTO18_06815 [Polaribacter porphyrae]
MININAYNLKKEIAEDDPKKKLASSVFFIQIDTLIQNEFNKILRLNKNEKYAIALERSLKLYDKSIEIGDLYWISKISFELGNIYGKTNNPKESLKYYKKSLQNYNKQQEETEINLSKTEMAFRVLRIGSTYQKIAVALENELSTKYIDSAKLYYSKLENIPALNKQIEIFKASAFNNLSGIYETDSVYDKAEYYILKALKINEKYKNNLKIASTLNNLGNIYLSQNYFDKSKTIYLKAIQLIKNDDSSKAIRFKASLYFNLAWAMRNLKDYKAYDFQELYYEYEDTIREREFRGIIENIQSKYNFNTQKELFLEQEENKRLQDQQTFIIIGIISLVIIISLIYYLNFFKLKQKNLALKLEQTELLKNKELDKVKSEAKTRIINATMDGEESERKKIAETLHDSVSALLSSANLHLQATRKQFNGNTPLEIDKTQEIISEATYKIRDLSHTLVSSVLLKFGLNYAIRDIAEKYSNSSLKVDTEIKNVKRYHQNFEIKVYNITHEFINNILKHSKASNAIIKLKEENNELIISITDDGIGFDKTKINDKEGLGINQIDARIQMMKGTFHIESALNKGTNIFVKLPIVEKEKPNYASLVQ